MKNIELIKQNFEKNNFRFIYVENRIEALEIVKKMLESSQGASVGGSETLKECGIIDYLENEYKGNYLDRYHCDDVKEIFHQALNCNTYLCSVNALVEDGSFLCCDGNGNRVSAIAYGPQEVILVVSTNKIVSTVKAGYDRINYIAAPMNATRLNKESKDIKHLTLHVTNGNNRMTIILVNEVLGY